MDNQPSEGEILAALRAIVVEALRIDPSRIMMEARIFGDLGAESIDILDIRFRVERAFRVKIPQQGFVRSLGEGLTASEIQDRFTVASVVRYITSLLQQQVEYHE